MEGYRKLVISVATILVEAILIWRGMGNLTSDVTPNVVAIINAIFNLIALFAVPTFASIYMHYNLKVKQLKKE